MKTSRPILEIKTQETTSGVLLYIPEEVVESFKQLCKRGNQYWERAPIEINEFVSSWVSGLPTEHFRINSIHKSVLEMSAEKDNGSTARGTSGA